MHSTDQYFTHFKHPIETYALPKRFTFPFFYQPHPLCLLAAEQLQQYLQSQDQWLHDFNTTGRMFGVLLVQNIEQEIGFLSAFSGKVVDQNLLLGFVPPVFDSLNEVNFFQKDFNEVNRISKQAMILEANPELADLRKKILNQKTTLKLELVAQQQKMTISRKERKLLRQKSKCDVNIEQIATLNERLAKQSIGEKNDLRDLKIDWQHKIETVEQELAILTDTLDYQKQLKRTLSAALQKKLFAQYRFLNIAGEERDLNDIFESLPLAVPPAGSGECAAPKLLQYAFLHGFKPLALAEFWWGSAPKSEIRRHGTFYPSCTSKCQPILGHMLEGIDLDDNPLLINTAVDKEIDIIYQDDAMLVINKPNDLLSVPGKSIKDSVLTRLRKQFPDATGPIIVHRLDMATSGLMLIALTQRANKSLTKQFRSRTIEKHYVALIDGKLDQAQGEITLPLRGNLYDRPRQLVCFEHGKHANTLWRVIKVIGNRTKLSLSPTTGRTHQLRVHCAHIKGLGVPIVGDHLYGKPDSRLHLHAQSIRFLHPYTNDEMYFEKESDF